MIGLKVRVWPIARFYETLTRRVSTIKERLAWPGRRPSLIWLPIFYSGIYWSVSFAESRDRSPSISEALALRRFGRRRRSIGTFSPSLSTSGNSAGNPHRRSPGCLLVIIIFWVLLRQVLMMLLGMQYQIFTCWVLCTYISVLIGVWLFGD